jgi:hypothetical protein
MKPVLIHSGSFFEFTFIEGAFMFEIEPNIEVSVPMYQEFLDALKHIYLTLGRPFPAISKVTGLFSMTKEARELAKAHRDAGVIYACASLSSNTAYSAMMKFILVVIGSKTLPRAYFTSPYEAYDWVEHTRTQLGHSKITEHEILNVFNLA